MSIEQLLSLDDMSMLSMSISIFMLLQQRPMSLFLNVEVGGRSDVARDQIMKGVKVG